MVWTPEPTYEKPDISVRATTLYYEIVAPIMLPFLKGRLLNLFRCREGKCFFQRNREHPPTGKEFDKLVHFEPVAQKNGRTEQYLYVESAVPAAPLIRSAPPGKLSAALRRQGHPHRHSARSGAEWDQVREFAKAFCTTLAEADPEGFTIALPKKERRGRIFLDFLRNQRTATAIMPYSARARAGMPVAAPVGWDELRDIDRSDFFTIADVEMLLKRAKSRKLKSWGTVKQRLPFVR